MILNKAVLIVVGGLDTANLALGFAPLLTDSAGLAAGIAYPGERGRGAGSSRLIHAVMGTGTEAVSSLPERGEPGVPMDSYGLPLETVGDVARRHGILTAAAGREEAAFVLGGSRAVNLSSLESEGTDPLDAVRLMDWSSHLLGFEGREILVIHYSGVEYCARRRDPRAVGEAVELVDWLAGELIETVDLDESLVVIAGDRGISPRHGEPSLVPTPICLLGGGIQDRVNLGVVHYRDIAPTLAAALGLPAPRHSRGADLYGQALATAVPGAAGCAKAGPHRGTQLLALL